jgi:hypothetical protein
MKPKIDFIIDESSNISNETVTDFDSRDLKAQENQRYAQDTHERRILSKWVRYVVSLWLAIVIIIIMLNNRFVGLSDTVCCVLLGTTTINILGLAFIVLRGLFDKK